MTINKNNIKRNKLNNKGFTLVEILATIALLGVVMLIAVGSFNTIRKKILERQYKVLVDNLYASGNKYYNDTGEIAVYVKELVEFGYYEGSKDGKVIDPVNGFNMEYLFLRMKDNSEKDLFYYDENSKLTKYNHNSVNENSLQYLSIHTGITATTVDSKNNICNVDCSNTRWTNENIKLEYYAPTDKQSKITGKPIKYKYAWYNANNSYKDISDDKSITIKANEKEVYEAEYILVVENLDEQTKTAFNTQIHIDKKAPTIDVPNPIEGASVQISVSDKGSGVVLSSFKINDNNCPLEDSNCENYVIENNNDNKYNITFPGAGTYNLYIEDNAGNTFSKQIDISNPKCNVYFLDQDGNELLGGRYINVDKDRSVLVPTISDYDQNLMKLSWYYNNNGSREPVTIINNRISLSDYCSTAQDLYFLLGTENYKCNVKYKMNNPNGSKWCITTVHDEPGKIDSTHQDELTVNNIFNNRGSYTIIAPAQAPKYRNALCISEEYNFITWSSSTIDYAPGKVITYSDFYNITPDNNDSKTMELNASWTKDTIHTLTLDANGGFFDNSEVKLYIPKYKNSSINLSNYVPSSEDSSKMFDGWCSKKDCSGLFNKKYSANANYTSNKDLTLYAQWKSKTYTITYDAQGGSFDGTDGCNSSKCVKSGLSGNVNIINAIPSNGDSSSFSYWSTSTGLFGSKYNPGELYTGQESITLYAKYKSRLSLSYSASGATDVPSTQYGSFGDSLTVGHAPTYPDGSNIVFKEWKSSVLGIKYDPGDSIKLLSSTKLSANTGKDSITITYDPNGGWWMDGTQNVKTQTGSGINKNTLISDHPNYGRYYEFVGWSCGRISYCQPSNSYDFSSSITLRAQYKYNPPADEDGPVDNPPVSPDPYVPEPSIPSTCSINYDTNGGGIIWPSTGNCGSSIPITTQRPSKQNFEFYGWSKNSSCSNMVSGNMYISESTTLYACYNPVPLNKHTVTFDTGYGSGYTSKSNYSSSYSKGDYVDMPSLTAKIPASEVGWNQSTKSPYYLVNWTCNGTTVSKTGGFVMDNYDITCSAKWVNVCKYAKNKDFSSENTLSNINNANYLPGNKFTSSWTDDCYDRYGNLIKENNDVWYNRFIDNSSACIAEFGSDICDGRTKMSDFKNTYSCKYHGYWCK